MKHRTPDTVIYEKLTCPECGEKGCESYNASTPEIWHCPHCDARWNPDNLPIQKRLEWRRDTEGSKPTLSEAEVEKIKAAFAANPEWDMVYLFHDGRIIEREHYSRSLSSRQSQLNAIASDGFPVIIGRGHSQIRMEKK